MPTPSDSELLKRVSGTAEKIMTLFHDQAVPVKEGQVAALMTAANSVAYDLYMTQKAGKPANIQAEIAEMSDMLSMMVRLAFDSLMMEGEPRG